MTVWGREQECDIRVFGEALAPWLGPRARRSAARRSPSPARLRAIAERAGLVVERLDEVVCPFEYADEEELLGPLFESALGRAVGRRAGPVALRAAVLERLQPYRTAAGGYRLENLFRVLVARAVSPDGLSSAGRSPGAGRVRIPGLEEALAEVSVRLDAEPGEPGPPQVQRHLSGGDPAAVGMDEQRRVVVGGKPERRPAPAQPVEVRRRRGRTQGQLGELVGAHPGVDQRPGHPVLPGDDGLLQEVPRAARRARRRPHPANVSTKPACAATPPLISAEAWWSSRTISARVTPSTADTAS